MSNFYTLLTRVGAALHANAQVNQTTVPWTHMRLGDGNGAAVVPTENQTGLVRQVHTLQITDIAVHPDNPNWVIAEAVVPSDVGGWTVRETAIYGGVDGNTCIAVGNYPETYKPVLAEGAGREMVMRMVVQISSVATVKLLIDPAVAIASRAWVESLVATPAKAGLVKLATVLQAIEGQLGDIAVTPEGLEAAIDIMSINGRAKGLRCSATGTNSLVPLAAKKLICGTYGLSDLSITIDLAAAGANGLDAGVLAASTWYSLWVIAGESGVAGLASLSATTPVLPAGYTQKCRIGWARTDASANKYPLGFTQKGAVVRYLVDASSNLPVSRSMASGVVGSPVTPTWVAVGISNFVPPTASEISVVVYCNVALGSAVAAPNNSYGSLTNTANPPPIIAAPSREGGLSSNISNFLIESQNIYFASNGAAANLLCVGWVDSI